MMRTQQRPGPPWAMHIVAFVLRTPALPRHTGYQRMADFKQSIYRLVAGSVSVQWHVQMAPWIARHADGLPKLRGCWQGHWLQPRSCNPLHLPTEGVATACCFIPLQNPAGRHGICQDGMDQHRAGRWCVRASHSRYCLLSRLINYGS